MPWLHPDNQICLVAKPWRLAARLPIPAGLLSDLEQVSQLCFRVTFLSLEKHSEVFEKIEKCQRIKLLFYWSEAHSSVRLYTHIWGDESFTSDLCNFYFSHTIIQLCVITHEIVAQLELCKCLDWGCHLHAEKGRRLEENCLCLILCLEMKSIKKHFKLKAKAVLFKCSNSIFWCIYSLAFTFYWKHLLSLL